MLSMYSATFSRAKRAPVADPCWISSIAAPVRFHPSAASPLKLRNRPASCAAGPVREAAWASPSSAGVSILAALCAAASIGARVIAAASAGRPVATSGHEVFTLQSQFVRARGLARPSAARGHGHDGAQQEKQGGGAHSLAESRRGL